MQGARISRSEQSRDEDNLKRKITHSPEGMQTNLHRISGCKEQYERTRISRGRTLASPKFRSQQFEKSCAGQRTKRKSREGYTHKTPKKGMAKKGVNGLVVGRRSEAIRATHSHKRMRKNRQVTSTKHARSVPNPAAPVRTRDGKQRGMGGGG